MPDAGYFGLTYELLFEGDSAWTDVTPLVDSRATKVDIAGCSEDLKSVISKCSFELRYGTDTAKTTHSALVGEILTAKQAGQTVQFRMGGIATFVGKVDLGSFSQKNGRIPGFVTVTVEDNSYLLDEKMDTSFEYPANDDLDDTGWAVFDKANLAQSIVMLRFLDAGYTIDQIDLTASDSITEKVRRVVYDADDERTYREMLDTLLFEHCAVIYTTPEGKLSVRRLYRETPVSERSVDDFLVADGIETSGGDYQFDGTKVVWSNLSRLDGAVVYNANITMKLDDDGNREGEEIQPQHYWPEDGDIEETWQEFNATFLDREYQTKVSRLKNKDLSLISVKNAYYEVDKDAEILLANNPPEIEPTKARVLWWNSHSTDVKKLYGFTIVGDALFRSKLNDTTYPTDAKRLDDAYETEFVYTSEAAAKLANHLHRFRKYGDLQHKWAEIDVDTPMFQVVTVSAPDTLISSLGMVISQSITFPAPNKVKRANSAIGITAFNSEPVKTRSVQLGGAPVNTGPAGSNGTRSVVQFILGTIDGPYADAGTVLGTDSALVGTSLALVGVDGAQWAYEAPTPDAGEIVWRREGYYTPPETWPKVWTITPMTGASSFGITLHPSALTVPVSSRGVPYGGNITISAVFQNIPSTYEITWGIVGASFVDEGTNQTKVVEVDTVTSDAVIITVSVLFGGVTYTDMVTLTKVWDGKPAPVYAGVHDSMFYDIGGEPLQEGDCFLYMPKVGEAYDDTNPLFGHVLKWDGDSWESTTDSQSIGFAAKDAFAIARESGKVIFAAVIYTEAMVAANVQAGSGTGVADSGFRFRAMDDDYSQEGNPKVPVFDVMYDNKKLFEVVATGTDAGDVIIGDYANGNGIKYDKSANKLLVNGTVEAGSVVPVSNVRNGLGQDGNDNNFSTFAYTTTPGYFPEGTNGSFGVSGATKRDMFCDDFIQVDTTKAYTFDMWAKAQHGLATTNHYLFYACYDADKIFIPTSIGGTFNYLTSGNLSSTWTKYSTVINGVADGDSPTKFRPGTRFIKIGALFNYSGDAYHELYISGITLREATPFSVDGTAFQTANGKVKIHNDGTIEAVDGSFTGNIVANSGLFKGIFDTTALKLEPGTANSHSASYANGNQAMGFCNYFASQGLSEMTFYKASIPSGIYNWRYSSSRTEQFNGGDVKYVTFDTSGNYYDVSFYDSNLAPVTTSGAKNARLGGTYNQHYVYGTLSITLYTGGDVLQLSDDVPISPDNIEAYQIYMNPETGALMAKLP